MRLPLMCLCSSNVYFSSFQSHFLKYIHFKNFHNSITSEERGKAEKATHVKNPLNPFVKDLDICRAFGGISSHWNRDQLSPLVHRTAQRAWGRRGLTQTLLPCLFSFCVYVFIWRADWRMLFQKIAFFHLPDPTENPLWWRFSPFEFRQRKSSEHSTADATQQFTKTDVGFNNFLKIAEQFTYFCWLTA